MMKESPKVAQPAFDTQLAVMYCPARRAPDTLNIKYDYFIEGTHYRSPFVGSCGDYAVCIGHATPGSKSYKDGERAFVIAKGGLGAKDGRPGGQNFRAFTDGLSNILLIGEKHLTNGKFGEYVLDNNLWSADNIQSVARAAGPDALLIHNPNWQYDYKSWPFGGPHGSMCHFAFADEAVHAVSVATSGEVLAALSQIADGQPVPGFDNR